MCVSDYWNLCVRVCVSERESKRDGVCVWWGVLASHTCASIHTPTRTIHTATRTIHTATRTIHTATRRASYVCIQIHI